jgi:FKBP-type peptidyl-prolyl cis-trans isomerase
MNKLSKKETIGVAAALALVAYLLFSGPLMSLFNNSAPTQANTTTSMNQTGFTAQDVNVGQGEVAQPGDIVAAHYVGKLENGQVFDSSRDRGTPIQFQLGAGQVIRGWDEGIVGMRQGGTRVLTIAPEFGYGAQAVGAIPANSTLIFEVELVGIQKASAQ